MGHLKYSGFEKKEDANEELFTFRPFVEPEISFTKKKFRRTTKKSILPVISKNLKRQQEMAFKCKNLQNKDDRLENQRKNSIFDKKYRLKKKIIKKIVKANNKFIKLNRKTTLKVKADPAMNFKQNTFKSFKINP